MGRSRKGRCNRKPHQLHKTQTGLCFWWSCKDRGNSVNSHCNDLSCQAHVQYTREVTYLLMELMLGTLSCSQTRSRSSLSLISQANMVGLVCFRVRIICTTLGVATLGLEPPITPGLMLPVSLYLNQTNNVEICQERLTFPLKRKMNKYRCDHASVQYIQVRNGKKHKEHIGLTSSCWILHPGMTTHLFKRG